VTSASVAPTAVALLCAVALHLAFPRTDCWWLAPFALGGLTASWCALPPRAAAFVGYASGLVFFGLGFSWFGETAGTLLGPAAPILVLGPAAIEALAFLLAALVASFAARRCDPRVVPLVVAAAYAFCEALRSSGVFGVPFSQIGVAMIDSPLRPLAAFVGGYGITFATALLGSSLGWWMLARDDRRRARAALVAWLAVALCTALAWIAWPSRHVAPPTRRVAAVQGGIEQSLKSTGLAGLQLAISRYTSLTANLRGAHPTLVLWPETVLMIDLGGWPQLERRLGALAGELGATLYVGNVPTIGNSPANGLFIFDPRVSTSAPAAVYGKEQLVPFAEYIPGPAWLRNLPFANEIGPYRPAHNAVETYRGATALICWESVFADIAHARMRDDPSLILIATDDAWFGTTQGPYEHAQAATLRAVESGRWILRAAATGISGIIAPDGRWTSRTTISTIPTTVIGDVGTPAPTLFATLGPLPIELALALLVIVPLLPRRRAA
jgi:apolipoprotein N-acyltransferase